MNKRTVYFITWLIMTATLAGCASVQKKFTRKKAEPDHKAATIYIEDGTYQKKFSNEYYYKTHYTMWQSWHTEWINQLGGNSKKLSRCAQETVGHLTEMSHYLVPEKQAEMAPLLAELTRLADKTERGAVSDAELGGMRTDLERLERLVANDFYFEKVKSSLAPDTVDLGAEK